MSNDIDALQQAAEDTWVRETADAWRALRRGTERALVDHMWQLPGEFIIARGGSHSSAGISASSYTADHDR